MHCPFPSFHISYEFLPSLLLGYFDSYKILEPIQSASTHCYCFCGMSSRQTWRKMSATEPPKYDFKIWWERHSPDVCSKVTFLCWAPSHICETGINLSTRLTQNKRTSSQWLLFEFTFFNKVIFFLAKWISWWWKHKT